MVWIGRSMCTKAQFTDWTYMGGTGPCGPMTIIFGSVFQSKYTSVNIKFGVNQTFHVLKTPVYWFVLYGRYQTLWTDDDNFWKCYLELVYKPKYQIWCESHVPCAQDPSLPIWLIWGVPDPVDRYSPFSIPTSVWVVEAYVQIFKYVALCVRTQLCLPQTDGQTDIAQIS